MLQPLHTVDRILAHSRPAWRWLGEVSLVLLGSHLAADHLEDLLFDALVGLGLGSAGHLSAVTWAAIALELLVATRITALLLLTAGAPPPTWQALRANWSVEALVRVGFWVPTGLAGAWVLGMAVEDATCSWLGGQALILAVLVALLACWRLLVPAVGRMVGGLFPPRRRTDGWVWAMPMLTTAGLAGRYGLPIWGGW